MVYCEKFECAQIKKRVLCLEGERIGRINEKKIIQNKIEKLATPDNSALIEEIIQIIKGI